MTNNPTITAASALLSTANSATNLRSQLDKLSTHVAPSALTAMRATVDDIIHELTESAKSLTAVANDATPV